MKKIIVLLILSCLSLTVSAQEEKKSSEIIIPTETLKSYEGKYELAPGAVMDITTKEQRIFLQLTGQEKFEIYPSSTTEFYLKVVEAKITFHSDGNGKITSLTLSQNGRNNPAKKIK